MAAQYLSTAVVGSYSMPAWLERAKNDQGFGITFQYPNSNQQRNQTQAPFARSIEVAGWAALLVPVAIHPPTLR